VARAKGENDQRKEKQPRNPNHPPGNEAKLASDAAPQSKIAVVNVKVLVSAKLPHQIATEKGGHLRGMVIPLTAKEGERAPIEDEL